MIAQALCNEAIYLSMQDREHQPIIDAGYLATALLKLNGLLDMWRDKIPYDTLFTFTDFDQLTNTNFVSVDEVNYILGNTQTPLRSVSLTQFNYLQNVIGLQSVPYYYYFDELAQTINVYPLPAPGTGFSFTVWGRVAQQPLTLTTVLPTNMPQFMIEALTYQTAFLLCGAYGRTFDPQNDEVRKDYIAGLNAKKSQDLSAPPDTVFGRPDNKGVPPFPNWYVMSGGPI